MLQNQQNRTHKKEEEIKTHLLLFINEKDEWKMALNLRVELLYPKCPLQRAPASTT